MTEQTWKEPIKIPDGSHSGIIVKVVERHEPYEYTDVVITLVELDFELKYGCPTFLSENTKLGKLMQAFGVAATTGATTDPEKVLVGRRCTFMTMMKKAKDGKEYAEIVTDSLKPEAEQSASQ